MGATRLVNISRGDSILHVVVRMVYFSQNMESIFNNNPFY